MKWLGAFEIVLSGIGFGLIGVLAKRAYAAGLTPGQVLSLRFVLASFVLGFALLLSRPRLLRVSSGQLARCAALGVFGYALFSGLFFHALGGLSASLTVLLLYAYPVLVALGASAWLGEKLAPAARLALPIACAGMALLVSGDLSARGWTYVAAGFGSAVFYSAYILASRKWLRSESALSSVLYIQLSAALVLSAIHLAPSSSWMIPARQAWPALAGIAILGTVLPMTLFLSGLRKVTSAEASILSMAEPITGVALAWLALGERLGGLQLAGGAMVLAAMALASPSPASLKGGTALSRLRQLSRRAFPSGH